MDLIRNIFNHVKAQSICQENQDKFWQITLHPCWRTKLFKLAARLFLMNRKKNYDFIFNDKFFFASHLVLLSIQNRPDIKSFMKSLPFQILILAMQFFSWVLKLPSQRKFVHLKENHVSIGRYIYVNYFCLRHVCMEKITT